MNEFCSLLEYLPVANSADVIAGDFNQHHSNLVKYTFSQIWSSSKWTDRYF